MPDYELTFIVRSDIADDEIAAAAEQVQTWAKDLGSEITKVDRWGRRRLAYPIKEQREGHYYLLEMTMDAGQVDELEHSMKLYDPILRYLLIRPDKD